MRDPLATMDMGLKVGAAVPLYMGRAGCPSNTMLPGQKHTSVLSGILIHPTFWPKYSNVADRQTRQRSRSIRRT